MVMMLRSRGKQKLGSCHRLFVLMTELMQHEVSGVTDFRVPRKSMVGLGVKGEETVIYDLARGELNNE